MGDFQVVVDPDEEVLQLLVELDDQLRWHREDDLVSQCRHQNCVDLCRKSLADTGVPGVEEPHVPGVEFDLLHLVRHRPERQLHFVEPDGVIGHPAGEHQIAKA